MFSHMKVIITPTDKMSEMLKVAFGCALDSQLPYHLIIEYNGDIFTLFYISAILMTNIT